jgi:hypothetical protein
MSDGITNGDFSSYRHSFFLPKAEKIALPLSRARCEQILRDQVEMMRQRLMARQCSTDEFANALRRLLELVLDGKVPKDLQVS